MSVAPADRSVQIAGRMYAVKLPRLGDPRLHVAAVIVTVQILGQAVLGFDVSIAQILICVATAGLVDLVIGAGSRRELAWPASGLLTGNGVALILRSPTTVHGDWWSTDAWPVFVAASGVAILSKYAIRSGNRPVFNPSNLGLVIVFLVFGSRYADPQDLWWGPWRPALAVTLGVIVVGGLSLASRLHLFSVALTFWATFAAGLAVLAWQGHAINARWHVGPVTDWSFWWVLVTSPEVMVFVFFMITDPRTAPIGRVARPTYAAAVGLLAAGLAGLQRTEFATKVSLLAALMLVCAARPVLERFLGDERLLSRTGRWWSESRLPDGRSGPRPTVVGISAMVALVVLSGALVAVAGSGTRAIAVPKPIEQAGSAVRARPVVRLAAGQVPTIDIAPELQAISGAVGPDDASRIAEDLVVDLSIESRSLAEGDRALAATATFGPELARLQHQISRSSPARVEVPVSSIHRALLVLLRDPGNPQALPQLGVIARGRETIEVRDVDGQIISRERRDLYRTYLVSPVGGHFLIGRTLAADDPMVVGDAELPAS